jgi:hypothetical protein
MAAILFDIPAEVCVRILLSPSYYLVTFTALAVGYGFREMKRWSWYVFLVANGLIMYENAILAHDYGVSHHKFFAFLISVAIQGGVMYQVAREVRVPYFFPRIRWWESNPRYKLSVPVKVLRGVSSVEDRSMAEGEILDISAGGCFVKARADFELHESLELRFRVFGHDLDCRGTVVWATQSTVTHPKGVGVKFDVLTRAERRTLRIVTRRLRKMTALYKNSGKAENPDEYLKTLEEMESKIKS